MVLLFDLQKNREFYLLNTFNNDILGVTYNSNSGYYILLSGPLLLSSPRAVILYAQPKGRPYLLRHVGDTRLLHQIDGSHKSTN
jgi:hypothetical protein